MQGFVETRQHKHERPWARQHPAPYHIDLAKWAIRLFTHPGELVVDPFLGSGTTAAAAIEMQRHCVGTDLNPDYVELARKRCEVVRSQLQLFGIGIAQCIHDDARNIGQYLEDDTVKLVMTSPPYANVLHKVSQAVAFLTKDKERARNYGIDARFTDLPQDLGNCTPEEWAKPLTEIFTALLPKLRADGQVIMDLSNIWDPENKRRIPLMSYAIDALSECGYVLRNIMIWDKRNACGAIGIYGYPTNFLQVSGLFEILLHFVKEST